MTQRSWLIRASGIALCLVLPGVGAPLAGAIPLVDIRYVETDAGGGAFRYEYTLFNRSSPVTEAGMNLFDVLLSFEPLQEGSVLALPAGWDSISGAGFIELFSVEIGEPPEGSDIPPGGFLSGFVLEFNYRAGPLAFDALLTNPQDSSVPIQAPGTTAAVPEPSSALLMLLVIVSFGTRFHRPFA